LTGKAFQVSELQSFAQALPVLQRLGATAAGFRGVVVGWPEHADETADEVFALLRQDEFEHFAVLLLAESNDGAVVNWLMKRPSTGSGLWGVWSEWADAMLKLVIPPSPVLPDLDQGGQWHLRVLFVDDSATVRIAFRRLLMKHGYLVETAEDVEDGWRKAQTTNFDLAIVDYFMPGNPGTVLVRRMKDDARTSGVLSAIITGTCAERVT